MINPDNLKVQAFRTPRKQLRHFAVYLVNALTKEDGTVKEQVHLVAGPFQHLSHATRRLRAMGGTPGKKTAKIAARAEAVEASVTPEPAPAPGFFERVANALTGGEVATA